MRIGYGSAVYFTHKCRNGWDTIKPQQTVRIGVPGPFGVLFLIVKNMICVFSKSGRMVDEGFEVC